MNREYENFTDRLVETGKKFKIEPVDIDDVLYTFPEMVLKFRLAFTDPKIRDVLIPKDWKKDIPQSFGFCGIGSYSLKSLFPELKMDHTPNFKHAWNVIEKQRYDVTGDQDDEELLKKYYADSFNNKSEQFKRANSHIINIGMPIIQNSSQIFMDKVFGWDIEK